MLNWVTFGNAHGYDADLLAESSESDWISIPASISALICIAYVTVNSVLIKIEQNLIILCFATLDEFYFDLILQIRFQKEHPIAH